MSPPQTPVLNLETCAETTAFLLEELNILAGICFTGLQNVMKDLSSGRSPQSLDLESRLLEIQGHLDAFTQAWQETDTALDQMEKIAQGMAVTSPEGLLGEMPGWEQEHLVWQEWHHQVIALMKKLHLIAPQSQLSALGRLPLDDLWEEIQGLAEK